MKATAKPPHTTMPGRAAMPAARVAAVCFLALALAACKGHGRMQDVAGWRTADPAQNHPVRVDRKEVVLELDVPQGSYGLSHNQKADLRGFVRRFREEGSGGVLVARAPSGGANEIAAKRAMDEVAQVIAEAGVAREDSVYESYSAGAGRAAPVRVSFLRHTAEGPVCGQWPSDLGRNKKNLPYENLGCATQRNLAAMVANPRDLVEPRRTTPRSSERRDMVWDKYIKGETTISEKADEEKSQVSEVEGGG